MFLGLSDAVVIAIIGLVGGAFGSVITLLVSRMQKPKINGEAAIARATAADQIGDAALALLKPYQDQVALSYERVRGLETETDALQDKVDKLTGDVNKGDRDFNELLSGTYQLYYQLVSMNAVPVFTPPDRRTRSRSGAKHETLPAITPLPPAKEPGGC